ncbi:MAG: hypothetical protein ACUVQC_03480 [Thermaceae bacterium]
MNVKYVLTSKCVQQGVIFLTHSLRHHLRGLERVRFIDEDGEEYEARLDWSRGVVEGLGSYFSKKRLQANEILLLSFQGEVVRMEVLSKGRGRRLAPQPEEKVAEPRESQPSSPRPETPKKIVRVTAYPREVPATPPAVTEELARLGFRLVEGGPPWVYQVHLGQRVLTLTLLRHGERVDLPPRGRVATLVPESMKEEVEGPVLTPEGLARLLRLKGRFPVSALDLEALLEEGGVDLERVEALEDRLARELRDRGDFAALLLLLSQRRTGEVFLLFELEEEASEEGLSPIAVRQGVEVLEKPPFSLLKRLSPGEFALRKEVEVALDEIAAFAQALRARISRTKAFP